jgi:hypothetical protein
MGTISANKLGGLSLALGAIVAVVFHIIQPGGMIIDNADPANAQASIVALASNGTLSKLSGLFISLGLLMVVYGALVIQGNIRSKGGNGDALSRYGVQLLLVSVVMGIIALALTNVVAATNLQSSAHVAAAGSAYSSALAINVVQSIIAAIAFLALSLGLASRDDCGNKIASLVVAVAAIVALVAAVIGGFDSSQLQTMGIISGVCYIIYTLWAIQLGLSLAKQE